MQSSQPILRHEVILHMRRNERLSEARKLQALKERLQTTVKQARANERATTERHARYTSWSCIRPAFAGAGLWLPTKWHPSDFSIHNRV